MSARGKGRVDGMGLAYGLRNRVSWQVYQWDSPQRNRRSRSTDPWQRRCLGQEPRCRPGSQPQRDDGVILSVYLVEFTSRENDAWRESNLVDVGRSPSFCLFFCLLSVLFLHSPSSLHAFSLFSLLSLISPSSPSRLFSLCPLSPSPPLPSSYPSTLSHTVLSAPSSKRATAREPFPRPPDSSPRIHPRLVRSTWQPASPASGAHVVTPRK